MKDADWQDCLENFSSVKITPDKQKAKSLIETSDERIQFSNKDINLNSCNYVFEDYYASILELIHALILLEGYNVKNHICLGFYLRDLLKRSDLFRIFDNLRFKRNSLVYYGKRMDFESCKKAIIDSKKLILELKSLLKGKL